MNASYDDAPYSVYVQSSIVLHIVRSMSSKCSIVSFCHGYRSANCKLLSDTVTSFRHCSYSAVPLTCARCSTHAATQNVDWQTVRLSEWAKHPRACPMHTLRQCSCLVTADHLQRSSEWSRWRTISCIRHSRRPYLHLPIMRTAHPRHSHKRRRLVGPTPALCCFEGH